MFFARIFSYTQRKRLCALAFAATRENLRARAAALAPALDGHGISMRHARLADDTRRVTDALTDPRPLNSNVERVKTVRRTARELAHTLDHLERYLATCR